MESTVSEKPTEEQRAVEWLRKFVDALNKKRVFTDKLLKKIDHTF